MHALLTEKFVVGRKSDFLIKFQFAAIEKTEITSCYFFVIKENFQEKKK